MDIPFFYSQKETDTITPQQLIYWLEKAARVTGWNALPNADERECNEFYLSLLGMTLLTKYLDFKKRYGMN
jgi:hypothetical protein